MGLRKIIRWFDETLTDTYYHALIGRWRRIAEPQPGYTVIIPVVPDFYAVLELNLRFLAACDLTQCQEVIVVADSDSFRDKNLAVVRSYADKLNIRYEVLPLRQRWLLKAHRTSHVIHTTNYLYGVQLSRTKYFYLHDGDFFLTDGDHLERLYNEAEHDGLTLLSTYTRPYEGYPHAKAGDTFPATFEILMRRDLIMSRPVSSLFAGNVQGVWYSPFTRFYLSVMGDTTRLHDTPGGDPRRLHKYADQLAEDDPIPVGLHFKHLFNRLRAYQEQGAKFEDSKYAIFLLYVLSSLHADDKKQLFTDLDEYFSSLRVEYSKYFPVFQRYLLQFLNQELLTDAERKYMTDAFERLKTTVESQQPEFIGDHNP